MKTHISDSQILKIHQVKLLISMALGLISCLAKILPMAVGLLCALRAGSIGWAQGMAILLGQHLGPVGPGKGGENLTKTWGKRGENAGNLWENVGNMWKMWENVGAMWKNVGK